MCSGAPGMNDGRRRIELEATAGLDIWNMKDSYLGNNAGLELREGRARILPALPGDICRGRHLSPLSPLPLGAAPGWTNAPSAAPGRTTAPGAVPGIIC